MAIFKEGDKVWVSYGVTINTGNFESTRVDMGMTLELDNKDEPIDIIDEIYYSVKAKVMEKKLEIQDKKRR